MNEIEVGNGERAECGNVENATIVRGEERGDGEDAQKDAFDDETRRVLEPSATNAERRDNRDYNGCEEDDFDVGEDFRRVLPSDFGKEHFACIKGERGASQDDANGIRSHDSQLQVRNVLSLWIDEILKRRCHAKFVIRRTRLRRSQ